jgi:hypothetical protein
MMQGQIGESMTELLDDLKSIQPGSLTNTAHLEKLVAASWDEFDGSAEEGMAGYKLHERMQDVGWNPPRLSFTIERHGGTVLGSSRAERHEWTLDVNDMTATCAKIGYRQIRPMAPRLDVRPLAEEIVQLIMEHKVDDRLKWKDDGTVRVQIGKIIPEGSAIKPTVAGRRRRFRQAVDDLLASAGWQCVNWNVYRPPAT